jgi:hypothetical protein
VRSLADRSDKYGGIATQIVELVADAKDPTIAADMTIEDLRHARFRQSIEKELTGSVAQIFPLSAAVSVAPRHRSPFFSAPAPLYLQRGARVVILHPGGWTVRALAFFAQTIRPKIKNRSNSETE